VVNSGNIVNLVMSGGGIKGVAFAGALEVAERHGYKWGNIAGVSAGALAGSYANAGYSVNELRRIIQEFDFSGIELGSIPKKVPVVERYIAYEREYGTVRSRNLQFFLNDVAVDKCVRSPEVQEFSGYRSNMLKNIVTLSSEGSLFDGDYLEEWVYGVLARKGIKTFADFRGGIVDRVNPRGYKVRMTAVDANRGRIIVLPDDIAFYGYDPDRLEVARAVRMSTCVPFAFKPVKIQKLQGNEVKTYHIVDGGVFDNFPAWLHDNMNGIPSIGLMLADKEKHTLLNVGTPLNILKALISTVHDIGVPKDTYTMANTIKVDTSKVSYLDFQLNEYEKEYLYNQGRYAAISFFSNYQYVAYRRWRNPVGILYPFLRKRYF
jgi:NTE family protein